MTLPSSMAIFAGTVGLQGTFLNNLSRAETAPEDQNLATQDNPSLVDHLKSLGFRVFRVGCYTFFVV